MFQKCDCDRFIGAASSYAGQGRCSVCQNGIASWMKKRGRVLWTYCDGCKQKEDEIAERKALCERLVCVAKASETQRTTGSRRGVYYTGFLFDRNDFQKAIAICEHNHEREAKALVCARRLKRKFIKELEA